MDPLEALRGRFSGLNALQAGDCCPECKHDVEAKRAEFTKQRRAREFVKDTTVVGKKGDRTTVTFKLDRTCLIQKFVAKDTAKNEGTRILFSTIAAKHGHWKEPRPTKEWAPDSLGCGINFGRFEAGEEFAIEVEFLTDCEWSAAIVGMVAIQ